MKDRLIEPGTGHVGTAALGCPVEQSSTGFTRGAAKPGTTPPAKALKSVRLLAEQLKSCAQIFLASLREIFDESAYARFLTQRQLVSSRAAYAAFRQEYEVTKARRPRCC
jgi:hypothetical protein